jgi:hypothetical protein
MPIRYDGQSASIHVGGVLQARAKVNRETA